MANSLVKLRKSAFTSQNGQCYYCSFLMWEGNSDNFQKDHKLSKRQSKRFQCTAEHLNARMDGGKNSKSNIVAACKHCNSTRHKRKSPPEPKQYKEQIHSRIKKGKWHDPSLFRLYQQALPIAL